MKVALGVAPRQIRILVGPERFELSSNRLKALNQWCHPVKRAAILLPSLIRSGKFSATPALKVPARLSTSWPPSNTASRTVELGDSDSDSDSDSEKAALPGREVSPRCDARLAGDLVIHFACTASHD